MLIVLLFVFVAVVPMAAFAEACKGTGSTVIFVNGILTSRVEAEKDKETLERKIQSLDANQDVEVKLAYNASHLGGGGDLFQSVTQAFGSPVSSYDLNTILMQIQPEVTTRKILLVGHSQGAFYTDEMYEYLIRHGVPKESIAVYNIATPESYVAGGGGYLTSTNDKVINAVRDAEINGNLQVYLNSYYTHTSNVVNSALRGNTTLPKEGGWSGDKYGGHQLGSVYLEYAAPRVVGDIKTELSSLVATEGGEVDTSGCFEAPSQTLAYKAQKGAFSIADTLIGASSDTADIVGGDVARVTQGIFGALASVAQWGATSSGSEGQVAAVAVSADQLPIQRTETKQVTTPSAEKTVNNENPKTEPSPKPTDSPEQTLPNVSPEISPQVAPQTTVPSSLVPVTPGFGGGGEEADSSSAANTSTSQSNTVNTATLSVVSPVESAILATTSVMFSGTADGGADIVATFGADTASTTADGSGNWSLVTVLPEGNTSVSVAATNTSGINSATVIRSVTVDTVPPDTPVATVSECGASLLVNACLIPVTDVSLAWGAATGASYYGVAKDGVVDATTTNLASQGGLSAGATTTFAVVAYDDAGNAATSTEVEVAAVTQPLVINEIGWGGTGTDPTNQWIEIQNKSSFDLNLGNISVERSGGSSVQLSGTLPASTNGSFLVVAPGNTNFFGAHVLTKSFTLATTTSEKLSLVWNASTTLDTTPDTAACSGWCAGAYSATLGSNVSGLADLVSPLSMERKSNTDGSLASSWRDTDSYGPWISGTSNAAVWGTPGAENSLGLPDAGIYCGSSTNFLTSSAPPGPSFSPGNDCVFLSKFVTGGTTGAVRYGGVFRGDIASSTGAGLSLTKGLASDIAVNVQNKNPETGEHFFFAIWENRSFGSDNTIFNFYFTQGASSTQGISGPPHGNYVTIPFVYAP